jgi:hydrogenase maturation protease
MMPPHTLILGIGSDYGDDRVGWRVIDLLNNRVNATVTLQCLRIPLQLLELDDHCDHWVIVDAFVGQYPQGTIANWNWPNLPTETFAQRNTHAFSLSEVLQLVSELNRFPLALEIWGVCVDHHHCTSEMTGQSLTETTERAAQEVVNRILNRLRQTSQLAGANRDA